MKKIIIAAAVLLLVCASAFAVYEQQRVVDYGGINVGVSYVYDTYKFGEDTTIVDKAGQIGELVRNTLPAAFSCALSLALATQLTKLPCTDKQLFELIKQRETRTEKEVQQNNLEKGEKEKE